MANFFNDRLIQHFDPQIQLKFRTKDRKSEVKLVIGLAEKFSVVMKQGGNSIGKILA